ncbi:MAG: N-acyl-D-amino-acid deacylase [Actinomycetota bacterium]|nr:N-acyl-D-amino-acid deacylase [Actinomycetota bacterium]
MFDVVLEGGWVVDGSGGPPFRADVALSGDRIAAIGQLADSPSAQHVSCAGRYLLPGFIDAHVHVEATVFDPEVQRAVLAQGITTCVVGQDGLSFAPASPAAAAYADEYFGAVNGSWPASTPLPATIADLLASYDGTTALNVGALVPQGNLRFDAVGSADQPASAAHVEQMRAALEAALDEGAVGLSSGLDYLPGRFADAAELSQLCAVAARYGVPYVTHMRGYEAAAAAGMREVQAIAEASGVAAHVSHYHGPANMLSGLVDDLRAGGIDVTFDSYPYTAGSSILAMVALPAGMQAAGPSVTAEHLADAEVRGDLLRGWFVDQAENLKRVRLSYVASDDYSWAEGLSLPEAAEHAGVTVGAFVCDVLVAAKLRVGCVFKHPPTNTDDDVRALMRHPAHVGSSDGIYLGSKPHPRAWGAFARFLGVHTRELGDWTWGEAALHLSGHTARRFGLTDRGQLRTGFAADIVVLDPAAIADVATYADPRRPAVGVDRVYVNGVLAFANGELTTATPGLGLRRRTG